jgi:hypothetical protein
MLVLRISLVKLFLTCYIETMMLHIETKGRIGVAVISPLSCKTKKNGVQSVTAKINSNLL